MCVFARNVKPTVRIARLDLQAQLVLVVVGRPSGSFAMSNEPTRSPSIRTINCSFFDSAAVELSRVAAHRVPGKQVLAVRREVVPNQQAAARAEGQPCDVCFLRVVLRREVPLLFRRASHARARQAADLARGRHVALDKRRRDGQPGRHVVEPGRRIVNRQVGGGVDFQPSSSRMAFAYSVRFIR